MPEYTLILLALAALLYALYQKAQVLWWRRSARLWEQYCERSVAVMEKYRGLYQQSVEFKGDIERFRDDKTDWPEILEKK
jgi:hypothetical protein